MFEPSRLVFARARRGLTKRKLSELSGISVRTLTTLENSADTSPTHRTLEALAAALGFPVDFLFEDEIELLSPDAVSFRALKSLSARKRDAALAAGGLALDLSDWIEERFELPVGEVPDLAEHTPELAAEALRTEWGLGLGPIPNVIHLFEAHGVRVFSLVEDCHEVDAFSFRRDGTPFMFLNTMKTAERSRMDAAHELGHLVLHPEYDRSISRQLEWEANAFASAFLMPGDSLIGRHSRFPNLEELIVAKRQWLVSLASYVYRLHTVGLITDWHYRSLFIELSKLGFKSSEPDGIARETSQLLDQVFRHLRGQGLSRARVAQELRVPSSDIDALVFGLVLSSVEGGGEQSASNDRSHLSLVARGDPPLAR